MTSSSFDVIVVGSGPAGVSAAFPLVQAGMTVLMVDGGREANIKPPCQPYLTGRHEDEDQWKWAVGEEFHALRNIDAVSPKLRVPTHDYVFSDFKDQNHIDARNFVAAGSLAKGGLSNAWGCGVARLSGQELADFPFPESQMTNSYEVVTRRIGVSGANNDDLSDYFGLDAWAQPPIPMDELHRRIFNKYSTHKQGLYSPGFRLGRSRVAALSRDVGERKSCDISGNCLWGCHRKALYSSADELPALMQYKKFHYRSGFVVERIINNKLSVSIEGNEARECITLSAEKVILAAGTLATTRLVLHALKHDSAVRLHSSPTAAFLLWVPRMLGAPRVNSFGLGQLSFSLDLTNEISAFGSTFSTAGIPVAEFVRHIPMSKRFSIDLLQQLLSSCLVGNMFLPGSLSTTDVSVNSSGEMKIFGEYSEKVPGLMSSAEHRLRSAYWKVGALLLPKSFTQGLPGGDIHYSGTLPMSHTPTLGQTNVDGEVAGLLGVHVADGACLPTLTEKSHTLTIMANADRIGRNLALGLTKQLDK
jgi:choline dehydrogenase-like flavoprotein